MDLKCIIRILVLKISVIIITAEKTKESAWLRQSLRVANQDRDVDGIKRSSSTSASDDGSNVGTLMASRKANECCLNGGLCIMNSFCHCKKKYYGRYCEHRVRHRSCGTIAHGTWMATGCHLCHCFDGKIVCKTSTIRGCERLSYAEAREEEPDYQVDVDKKFEDYDKFYDTDVADATEEPPTGNAPITSTFQVYVTVLLSVLMFQLAAMTFGS